MWRYPTVVSKQPTQRRTLLGRAQKGAKAQQWYTNVVDGQWLSSSKRNLDSNLCRDSCMVSGLFFPVARAIFWNSSLIPLNMQYKKIDLRIGTYWACFGVETRATHVCTLIYFYFVFIYAPPLYQTWYPYTRAIFAGSKAIILGSYSADEKTPRSEFFQSCSYRLCFLSPRWTS